MVKEYIMMDLKQKRTVDVRFRISPLESEKMKEISRLTFSRTYGDLYRDALYYYIKEKFPELAEK
jgi:hypothetical protein